MNHFFAHWNVLDYVLAAVFAFSVILSFFRGFLREAISLITWFLAFYLALEFAPALSGSLHSVISHPKTAYVLSFIIIFIIVMILGAVVKKVGNGFTKITFLGFFDKILGIAFGAVRGVLFVAIILFIIQLTPAHDAAWMKSSQLVPHFQGIITRLNALLPKELQNVPATLKERITSFANSLISRVKN